MMKDGFILKNTQLTNGRKIMTYIIKTNLSSFYRIPDFGSGYYLGLKANRRHWGQAFLILFLIELGQRWASLQSKHPFGIGDIANENGSLVTGHISHTQGTAVDLYIIHKDRLKRDNGSNAITWNEKAYDRDRTLQFVKLIKVFSLRYGMMQILYNDPYVIKEANKLGGWPLVTDDSKTEHSKDQHHDHIHITFTGKIPYASHKRVAEILEAKNNVRRSNFSIDMCGIHRFR